MRDGAIGLLEPIRDCQPAIATQFIRYHVRRLRSPAPGWSCLTDRCRSLEVPKDIVERKQVYDPRQGGDGLRVPWKAYFPRYRLPPLSASLFRPAE